MRLASWNVNSVKARLPLILDWIKSAAPDVLLLQEIKCETDSFPRLEFMSLGYHLAVVGQKSYNGVALLSRTPFQDVIDRLPGDEGDVQARYLEATVAGFRVATLYLPNGNPVDSDKFPYKQAWMQRLQEHAARLLALETPVALGGDFNVIPMPEDVYDPQNWVADALFHPSTRAAFRRLVHLGYTDAFRAQHPHKKHAYTFWDYQAGAWQRDNGLRIDHFLLSPEAVDLLANSYIDRTPRGWEKTSDHTPMLIELRDGTSA